MLHGDISARQHMHLALEGKHPKLGEILPLALNLIIVLSCVCIAVETMNSLSPWLRTTLYGFEFAILTLFFVEYFARLYAAPDRLGYAVSVWGIIDLLCWIPLVLILPPEVAAIRVLRLMRLLRVAKALRGSRALSRLERALLRMRGELLVFSALAAITIYVGAVGIYIFESEAQPQAFGSIPQAAWWALVSFTTVGYGDAYPITLEGKLFTSFILIVGLGIIAVPAAVITTALIDTERKPSRKDPYETHSHARRRPRVRGNRSLRHVRARAGR